MPEEFISTRCRRENCEGCTDLACACSCHSIENFEFEEEANPPPVLDVHKAALQEIDRVVGNELTLDESDTTKLRGILFAALSEEHTRG